MDAPGLELVGGDLVKSMEETGWINAARGDDGAAGALGSHHYIYNSPVDYKVLWRFTQCFTEKSFYSVKCREW